mgnify:CR=1 FL=1
MAKKERKYIKIRGASEHNLKCVSLDIPRDEFVVFTGLSGSGKSSLAFDTIYAEGQRIHCGCSTGKSFSQHLLCIYLSTGPIIPSHTGQRGGNTRLITPLPISFILFTNPPDCNIPICNNINKKATIHSCNAGTYHRPHGCLL